MIKPAPMDAAAKPLPQPPPSPELAPCEFTILMPCLNEAETLERCVRKAQSAIARLGLDAEVVVADNGSTDGSQKIARDLGARVVDVPVRGYGAALFYGTRAARGRYIIMGDSDDSYDFSRIDPFIEPLRAGNDVVMGNRFLGGIRPGAMPWKNRHIGNPVLSGIGKLFFRCPVNDFHCGMRGISRAAFDRLDLKTTGMEFASEMVIKATLMKLKMVEVPTTLDKDGRSRPPHLRPWRDGWRHLRFMLLYSPTWLFFYPGLVLMIAGLVLGGLLLPGRLVLFENISLGVHTLLFALAGLLIGFQAVSFFVCARAYATNEGFLPAEPWLDRGFKQFRLEGGLTVGLLVFLAGLGGAAYTVSVWAGAGFGNLHPEDTLRAAIPSVVAMCLGAQTVLVSFLLSFLGLNKR
jgi:glycosyltransferase involved in cell wall biosynthesis